MKNTINLYEDKRRSKLYVRYRINGTSRDETLQLEWHSNVWMDKHIKINNKSKKLAEELSKVDFSTPFLDLDSVNITTRKPKKLKSKGRDKQ